MSSANDYSRKVEGLEEIKVTETPEGTTLRASASRIVFALLRLSIGFAIIFYLVKSGSIDWRALSKLFTQWPITLVAVALLLFDVALIALRLCWLFRPLGMRLRLYDSMQLTLIGFLFATFLPGAAGGDLARIFYAAKEKTARRTEIIAVLIFDRVIGLFSLLLLPLSFAPMFPNLLRTVPVVRALLITVALFAAGMLGAFLILVFKSSWMNQKIPNTNRLFPRRHAVEQLRATIATYRRSPWTLLLALGISLVANLSLVAVTALGVLALNPASWSMEMCIMIPIGHIANSLPITPGGLGVGETAFNALFGVAGLRGGAEALLCWRIWRALVSLLGLAFYLRGFRLRFLVTEATASSDESSAESKVCPK
ncbi:MAG TPA: lysylphosphatidylglycerol synthase transmembrane domain-containing protein [Candidatus Dormibacteraeota bacterium]|nr:lysylphosphatidylglycerol synthase transmembrane domain-containing protein [Candidatus Dormibacteraeota bacterium]